jgi:hypothetical protein
VPVGSGAGAFAAQFGFVPQRDVDDTALAAVHRVEPEWRACVLDLFSGSARADAQFLNAERAVIIRIERNSRVIVGVQAQNFLRHQFQRQKQLGAVGQKKIDIMAAELYNDIGVFKIGMALIAGFNGKLQIKSGLGDDLAKEFVDAGASLVDRESGTQAFFLPSFGVIF